MNLQGESGYQQDICEASRKTPDTSSKAVKSLERVLDQQDSYEFPRKSLGTSRIAVESLGRVWGPAG